MVAVKMAMVETVVTVRMGKVAVAVVTAVVVAAAVKMGHLPPISRVLTSMFIHVIMRLSTYVYLSNIYEYGLRYFEHGKGKITVNATCLPQHIVAIIQMQTKKLKKMFRSQTLEVGDVCRGGCI